MSRGRDVVRHVFVAFGVLARGDAVGDFDVHPEGDFLGVGLDAVHVRLDYAAAFEVGDRRDEGDVDPGECPVDDRESVKGPLVGELEGLPRVAAAALGAGHTRLQRDRSTFAALKTFQVRVAGLWDL